MHSFSNDEYALFGWILNMYLLFLFFFDVAVVAVVFILLDACFNCMSCVSVLLIVLFTSRYAVSYQHGWWRKKKLCHRELFPSRKSSDERVHTLVLCFFSFLVVVFVVIIVACSVCDSNANDCALST